jgi:hypothetical protein
MPVPDYQSLMAPTLASLADGGDVNVGRILTPWRRLNVDPLACGFVVLAWFCGGRGDAAEVSVLEAVAVSLQCDDVGVVDEAVDHGGGDGIVAEDLAPPNWNWLRFLIGVLPFDLLVLVFGVSA